MTSRRIPQTQVAPSGLSNNETLRLPSLNSAPSEEGVPAPVAYCIRLPNEVIKACLDSDATTLTFETDTEGTVSVPGYSTPQISFKNRSTNDTGNETAHAACFSRRGTCIRAVGPILGDIETVDNRAPHHNPRMGGQPVSAGKQCKRPTVNDEDVREPAQKRRCTQDLICKAETPPQSLKYLQSVPPPSSGDVDNVVTGYMSSHPRLATPSTKIGHPPHLKTVNNTQASSCNKRTTLPSLPLLNASAPAPSAVYTLLDLGLSPNPRLGPSERKETKDESRALLDTGIVAFEHFEMKLPVEKPRNSKEEIEMRRCYEKTYEIYIEVIRQTEDISKRFMELEDKYQACLKDVDKRKVAKEIQLANEELRHRKNRMDGALPRLHSMLKSIKNMLQNFS